MAGRLRVQTGELLGEAVGVPSGEDVGPPGHGPRPSGSAVVGAQLEQRQVPLAERVGRGHDVARLARLLVPADDGRALVVMPCGAVVGRRLLLAAAVARGGRSAARFGNQTAKRGGGGGEASACGMR